MTEEAREEQGTRTDLKSDIKQIFAESTPSERQTRHRIAKQIGLGSGETYRKAEKMWLYICCKCGWRIEAGRGRAMSEVRGKFLDMP